MLTVNGSTDNIRELVRNSNNYQVRVRFTNLQYKSNTDNVKYWRVNRDLTAFEHIVGQQKVHDNPFVAAERETVETVSADVLKIEVVKIK